MCAKFRLVKNGEFMSHGDSMLNVCAVLARAQFHFTAEFQLSSGL